MYQQNVILEIEGGFNREKKENSGYLCSQPILAILISFTE